MNIPALVVSSYDNILLYYPNLFSVMTSIVIVAACFIFLRCIKVLFSIIYLVGAGVYSKKSIVEKLVLKKYGKFSVTMYKFFRRATIRISILMNALKKEFFINPKDL